MVRTLRARRRPASQPLPLSETGAARPAALNRLRKSTILATARVSAADIITISLVEPSDAPAAVFVRWPGQPSVTDPYRLPALANAVMAVLAEAVGKLATIRTDEL